MNIEYRSCKDGYYVYHLKLPAIIHKKIILIKYEDQTIKSKVYDFVESI